MTESEEGQIQQLRSKATELLLREEYTESISVYSHLISICQQDPLNHDHRKSLSLALSNRAEARFRLGQISNALEDCDEVLAIESAHFKTLVCKGKLLMSLNKYASALDCFRAAQLFGPRSSSASLDAQLEKCKRMDSLSRTGAFDISDWVASGFRGNSPELAEFVGPVEIRKSKISGRGIFATKSLEAGALLFVSRAVATDRTILSTAGEEEEEEPGENLRFDMWKNLVEKVAISCANSRSISTLFSKLSDGEEEENNLDVPNMNLFRPGVEFPATETGEELRIDRKRVASVLDANSLVERSASSKAIGGESYGIGLWILAAFVNHSCAPNARRVHVGDYAAVHASRDVSAGEELTFAYFDVLRPLPARRAAATETWGFVCCCERCEFEGRGERALTRRERAFSRASSWPETAAVESVAEAVGSDERLLKVLLMKARNSKIGGNGVFEMEKAFKLGRGLFGKLMKKQALRMLLNDLI